MNLHKNVEQNKVKSTGKVFIAGAGPGDPELITVKVLRLLQTADVIVFDRLVNAGLLAHTRPDARLIRVGKQPGRPSVSQEEINRILVTEALAGSDVLRLKGGDPFVFGRGGEECLVLAETGIAFEVVPGISSVTGATSYAGIPLTMRNLATGFSVISGHLHPDSPQYEWSALARVSTLVILMGLRNLPDIAIQLQKHGRDGKTPAALIRWGTTGQQLVVTGTLADIGDKAGDLSPPVTVVIGEVVNFHHKLQWFTPQEEERETILQDLEFEQISAGYVKTGHHTAAAEKSKNQITLSKI